MCCIKKIIKIILALLLTFGLAFADSGTESTTDEGLRCDAPSKKYSGYFCKGKNGGDKFCTICNVCGDKYQIADDGEECDLNNKNHPSGRCNNECKLTYCGDNVQQRPNGRDEFVEECDQGAANSPTGVCAPDCKLTYCGDQTVQAPNGHAIIEQCDEGTGNNIDTGTCSATCQITYCGDEILQRPNGQDNFTEECDKDDFYPGFPNKKICRDNCTVAYCGDEKVENIGAYKEECDSRVPLAILAIDDTAICTTDSCELRYCGNARLERDEQCDKGVDKNGNKANENRYVKGNDIYYCNASCQEEELPKVCGDGIKSPSVGEECDYGVNNGNEVLARKGEYYCTKQCKWKHKPNCLWIGAWRNWSTGHSGDANRSVLGRYKQVRNLIKNPTTVPSCFNKALGGCRRYDQASHAKIGGWCNLRGAGGTAQALRRAFGVGNGVVNLGGGYMKLDFYFDKNCNWIPNSQVSKYQICGFAGASWSPISLIWEEGANLHEGNTLVDFPLNPMEETARHTVWKASSQTPLLVYDPLKTGKVKDARQLFGSWTYGGQQNSFSHLSSMGKEQEYTEPWEDGYQALALLDIDRNQRIEEAELNDLYLWFDQDRDAEVDPGELKSVISQGISALFYKDPEQVGKSADLGLTYGYERIVDGQKTSGQSIDWFGNSFESKRLALDVLLGKLNLLETDDTTYARPEFSGELSREDKKIYDQFVNNLIENSVENPRDNLSGLWMWAIKEEDSESNSDLRSLPGLFAIQEDSYGNLKGYSVVESSLAENDADVKSLVRAFPLSGKVTTDLKGKKEVVIKIKDNEMNSKSLTVALVDVTGLELSGLTTQFFDFSELDQGSSVKVDYRWQATKIN